jgi:hypothetical protein
MPKLFDLTFTKFVACNVHVNVTPLTQSIFLCSRHSNALLFYLLGKGFRGWAANSIEKQAWRTIAQSTSLFCASSTRDLGKAISCSSEFDMAKGITFAFEKIGNNDPVDRFAVCEMS